MSVWNDFGKLYGKAWIELEWGERERERECECEKKP